MKLILESYGIIAVSLGVEIVNCLLFSAICVRLHPDFNTHAFGHKFFGREGHCPPSQKVPKRLIPERLIIAGVVLTVFFII